MGAQWDNIEIIFKLNNIQKNILKGTLLSLFKLELN